MKSRSNAESKSLFTHTNYREYLQSWLDSQESARGLLSQMAREIGCQSSHLTRLLREEVHLTPDQAFATSQFLKLTEMETRYFLKLVEFERAGTIAFRERLSQELNQIRSEHENLSKRFQQNELGHHQREMTYYSVWFWAAIHIATDIPRYQTAHAIALRLALDERFVRSCLETLEGFGLVKRGPGDVWKISSNPIHLPATSPMTSVLHGNWRTRAVADSQNPNSNGLHYTIVQSLAAEDFARVKQSLLESIDRYRKIADPSSAEDLVCFTCDFFRV